MAVLIRITRALTGAVPHRSPAGPVTVAIRAMRAAEIQETTHGR